MYTKTQLNKFAKDIKTLFKMSDSISSKVYYKCLNIQDSDFDTLLGELKNKLTEFTFDDNYVDDGKLLIILCN